MCQLLTSTHQRQLQGAPAITIVHILTQRIRSTALAFK